MVLVCIECTISCAAAASVQRRGPAPDLSHNRESDGAKKKRRALLLYTLCKHTFLMVPKMVPKTRNGALVRWLVLEADAKGYGREKLQQASVRSAVKAAKATLLGADHADVRKARAKLAST